MVVVFVSFYAKGGVKEGCVKGCFASGAVTPKGGEGKAMRCKGGRGNERRVVCGIWIPTFAMVAAVNSARNECGKQSVFRERSKRWYIL